MDENEKKKVNLDFRKLALINWNFFDLKESVKLNHSINELGKLNEKNAQWEKDFWDQEVKYVESLIGTISSPEEIVLLLKEEKIRLKKIIATLKGNEDKRRTEFVERVLQRVILEKIPVFEEEVQFRKEKQLFDISQNNSKQINPDNTAKRRSVKEVKTKYSVCHSFILKAHQTDKEYFKKNVVIILDTFQELKKNFFSDDTNFDQFKLILTGSLIKPHDRIDWTGSFIELNIFVKLLNYDLKKIVPIKNGLWETTAKCFTKNGAEIRPEQISKANGKTDREEILNLILQKL